MVAFNLLTEEFGVNFAFYTIYFFSSNEYKYFRPKQFKYFYIVCFSVYSSFDEHDTKNTCEAVQ